MKFYHATNFSNISSIIDEGLVPGADGIIYLADSFVNAVKFVILRGYKRILVCEVELDESQVEETFDHSSTFFQCKSYGYDKVIPFFDIVLYEYKERHESDK